MGHHVAAFYRHERLLWNCSVSDFKSASHQTLWIPDECLVTLQTLIGPGPTFHWRVPSPTTTFTTPTSHWRADFCSCRVVHSLNLQIPEDYTMYAAYNLHGHAALCVCLSHSYACCHSLLRLLSPSPVASLVPTGSGLSRASMQWSQCGPGEWLPFHSHLRGEPAEITWQSCVCVHTPEERTMADPMDCRPPNNSQFPISLNSFATEAEKWQIFNFPTSLVCPMRRKTFFLE